MSRATQSLLAGRSTAPLTEENSKSVARTFVGLDNEVPYEPDHENHTRFVVSHDEAEAMDVGIVLFGRDIYPGPGVADPNSALSMKAAVAHEASHYHRWMDQTELPLDLHRHLDEAMTSLDAALRFAKELSGHEVQQLIRDALQRLALHYADINDA